MNDISVNDLNLIQKEWMDLSGDASEGEKTRVFALMEKLPRSHITGREGSHNVLFNGMPLYAGGQPLEVVKAKASAYGIRTDISWDCAGKWISIEC